MPAIADRTDAGRERTHGRGTWIPELDGLRAAACLAVVLAHYNPAPLHPSRFLLGILQSGFERLSLANIGVTFFYTLSAFLLTYLATRESRQPGGFSAVRFWVRRCLRIWPLYFVVLGVAALRLWSEPGQEHVWGWTADRLWLFGLFLSNWSLALNHVGGYIDHSIPDLAILWSIAVEEQFYLAYPLLFLIAMRSRRAAVVVSGTLAAAALVFRAAFLFIPVDVPVPSSSGGMYYATLTYLDVFLAGALAGWIAAGPHEASTRVRSMMNRRGAGILLVSGCVLLSLAWNDRWWYPYGWMPVVGYGMTGITLAAVLFWVWANPDARVCRVLRSGPMRTLGILSYGMYLWHPLAGSLARWTFTGTGGSLRHQDLLTLAHWALYVVATIGAAALTYGLVERPFLRLKEGLARASPTRSPQLVAKTWAQIAIAAGVTAFAVDIAVQRWLRVPAPGELSRLLGAQVETAPGELNQYLIRGEPGTVDLSRVGEIHTVLGPAVGVTLSNGLQIGFRYEPLAANRTDPAR